jgi:hypothetical protein
VHRHAEIMAKVDGHRLALERGRRNIGKVNLDRLAGALAVDLPTLMAGVEAQRTR